MKMTFHNPPPHPTHTQCKQYLLLMKFWWNLKGRFPGTSRKGWNCHRDICTYQQYHCCYWSNFDQTFWPNFVGGLNFCGPIIFWIKCFLNHFFLHQFFTARFLYPKFFKLNSSFFGPRPRARPGQSQGKAKF